MKLKNKTLAVYLALLLGTYGIHRFYLKGWRDIGAWLHMLVMSLGLTGLRRAWILGQDDKLAWVLAPLLGLSIFAACLAAIIYGLSPEAKWNEAYEGSGKTSGLTVFGVILALLLGATALMSAIAYSGQKFFETTQTSA